MLSLVSEQSADYRCIGSNADAILGDIGSRVYSWARMSEHERARDSYAKEKILCDMMTKIMGNSDLVRTKPTHARFNVDPRRRWTTFVSCFTTIPFFAPLLLLILIPVNFPNTELIAVLKHVNFNAHRTKICLDIFPRPRSRLNEFTLIIPLLSTFINLKPCGCTPPTTIENYMSARLQQPYGCAVQVSF